MPAVPVWRIHRHVGMGGDQLVPALVPGIEDDLHQAIQPLDQAHELIADLKERGLESITGGWSKAELLDAGAAMVYESIDELRRNLDETPLSFS